MITTHPLHEKAARLAKTYLDSERHLVEVLEEIDLKKIWRSLGYPSFFEYTLKALNLSTSQAYILTSVARKCQEVPELKTAITLKQVSLSNAKRILPVLNNKNKETWLTKAETLSTRNLEKEVAELSPRTKVIEAIKPISKDLYKMTTCIDDETEMLLKNAQDLLSKNLKKNLDYEVTIREMARFVIKHLDPVEKAKRAFDRKNTRDKIALQINNEKPIPRKIPNAIQREIYLRDNNQCQAITPEGKPCNTSRFTELHHSQPLSQGGIHHVNNLVTLCSAHHKMMHENRL